MFDNYVELSGIGKVELVKHRPIPSGFVVKKGTVKLEADSWYVSFSLEDKSVPRKEDEEIYPTTQNGIGIDLGLERFLTCDDGSYIKIPRLLRKSSKRMTLLQHRKFKLTISPADSPSKGGRRAPARDSKDKQKLYTTIAKLHQKIARQRLNFQFNVAYKLFAKADVIFVEDLKLKNLIRRNKPKLENGQYLPNGQSSSSGMNKSWLDAAHGQFVQILEWVAWKLGKRVIKVDPWGTSQYCHACLNKVPKTLNDRWHSCSCGASLNRDENSAKLIKSVGLGLALRKIAPRGKEARSLCVA